MRKRFHFLIFILASIWPASPLLARIGQAGIASGSIRGVVHDATGAVTSGVAMRARVSTRALSDQGPSTSELRVNAHGLSLHAALRWRADQRLELEQLCRYITRPAIANERLKRNRAGRSRAGN